MLPTRDELIRMGAMVDDKCLLCSQEEEDPVHLFKTCLVARNLWSQAGAGFNWSSLIAHNILEWLKVVVEPLLQGEGKQKIQEF